MLRTWALLALTAVAVTAAAADDKKEDDDLQGSWVITSALRDGQTFDEPGENSPVGDKLTFEKGAVKIERKKGSSPPDAKYTLDAKKSPKELDISPPNNETNVKGIYVVKGEELKICMGGPDQDRPDDFKAEQGSMRFLLVLKRQKP
jgi:uncharacterized protein (TIGR03067 family)